MTRLSLAYSDSPWFCPRKTPHQGVSTTVTLSSAFRLTITVNYTASNGTALSTSDYAATLGTLTFPPDVTVLTFTVPITNDALYEITETVNLALGNPVSATLGTANTAVLTILDDDPPPQVHFASGTYTVTENLGPAPITVTLSAASSLTATVNYTTTNGTALAGSDYTTTAGLLTFPPGVITQTFNIPIINDAVTEVSETVNLTLTTPTSATLGVPITATLTIVDDDAVLPTVISYTYDSLYRLTRADYSDSRSPTSTAAVTYATSIGSPLAGSVIPHFIPVFSSFILLPSAFHNPYSRPQHKLLDR